MLGYTYSDIQEMIQAVDASLTQVDDTDDPWLHSRLAMTHSLLNGLLAEGYIDENTFYGDDVPNEAMDYAEEIELMGLN